MTVCVTGAGGFIGRYVLEALLTRLPAEEIVAVVRSPERAAALRALGVRVAVTDLRDRASLVDVLEPGMTVFHLAAKLNFGMRGKASIDFHGDNVDATESLLSACPDGLRRFVFMSSVNAVERAVSDRCTTPINESSPCRPTTAYGMSKLAAEEAVRRTAAAQGLPFLILRPPSIVYGAGSDRASGMATLITQVQSGAFATSLDFPGRFSLIHVKDLADETVRLGLSDDYANETYFLADEPPRTMGDICTEIARQLGASRTRRTIPPIVARFGASLVVQAMRLPAVAKRVPFQLLMLLRDQATVSSAKARREAGFTTRIDLTHGLADTIPWVLARDGRAPHDAR